MGEKQKRRYFFRVTPSIKHENLYFSTTCLPKGVKANAASLKCCLPNGMPMMVMQRMIPNTRCVTLIQIPPKSIQRMFMMILRHPPACGEVSIRFPKGQRAKKLSFKVWMPKGIPMMVIIIPKLAMTYSTAVMIPPKSNQSIFINMIIFP